MIKDFQDSRFSNFKFFMIQNLQTSTFSRFKIFKIQDSIFIQELTWFKILQDSRLSWFKIQHFQDSKND